MKVEVSPMMDYHDSSRTTSLVDQDTFSAIGKKSSDLLFETRDALIRITGSVRGVTNLVRPPSSNGFFSSQHLRDNIFDDEDGNTVSDYATEDLSITDDTSSGTKGEENSGMFRRFSSSISEMASSIISNRTNNEGSASRKSSAPSYEISATPRNEPIALNNATISASKPINSHSESNGITQETATSARQNPFSRDINFLHDFYNEGVLLSSSQPTRFFSGPEVEVLGTNNNASSTSLFDLPNGFRTDSLSEIDRRRSLDIEFTEGFFAEPRSVTSSLSSSSEKFSRREQLLMAIEECKRMLKENQSDEKLKEKFGHQLVKLRLMLLEESETSEEQYKRVNGHKMVPTLRKRTSKAICEHCNQYLIGLVHSWHECFTCGYRVHDKCLELSIRVCPSVQIENSATFNWDICTNSGLSSQNFRCAECKRMIGGCSSNALSSRGSIGSTSSLANVSNLMPDEARLCDYSGLYYCSGCHWNDTMVIPCRVVLNWDFSQYKVSRYWRSYLQLMHRKAVIDISKLNTSLYNHIEELAHVDQCRMDILKMKTYFVGCRNASANRLLLLLQSRQHFVENANMYSMQDLIDIENKSLIPILDKIHTMFSNHIRRECEICRNRGFICEICNSNQIIFPFDTHVYVCAVCSNTYHDNCFEEGNAQCLRCSRRKNRNVSEVNVPDPELQSDDDDDDFIKF